MNQNIRKGKRVRVKTKDKWNNREGEVLRVFKKRYSAYYPVHFDNVQVRIPLYGCTLFAKSELRVISKR